MKPTDRRVSRMKKFNLSSVPFSEHTMHSLGQRMWCIRATSIRRHFLTLQALLTSFWCCKKKKRKKHNTQHLLNSTCGLGASHEANKIWHKVKVLLCSETVRSGELCVGWSNDLLFFFPPLEPDPAWSQIYVIWSFLRLMTDEIHQNLLKYMQGWWNTSSKLYFSLFFQWGKINKILIKKTVNQNKWNTAITWTQSNMTATYKIQTRLWF